MPKRNIHVTQRKDAWAVIKEKSKKAIGLYSSQSSAIKVARTIAKKNKSELVIHGKNNLIRDKDSYGNDPFPPRDKKY